MPFSSKLTDAIHLATVNELTNDNNELQIQIDELNNIVASKDAEIARLKTSLSDLQALYDAAIGGNPAYLAYNGSWVQFFGTNKANNYIVECNGSACSNVAVSKDVAKIGFNISNIKFKVNAIEICTNALNKTQALKIGAFIGSGIQYIIFDKLDIQDNLMRITMYYGNDCKSKADIQITI